LVIGVAYITIQIFESHSLKEKRRVVRSVIERARARYNAGIAEVDFLDTWQMAGIGITCVSNSSAHANQMLSEIVRFFESNVAFGALADVSTELIHVD
jgi:uncharacterized protein YlxP (DUF503 family)